MNIEENFVLLNFPTVRDSGNRHKKDIPINRKIVQFMKSGNGL